MSAAPSFHLNPVLPGWLLAAIALALLAAVAWAGRVLRRKRVTGRWIAILSSLRVAAVVVFVIGLLQPVLSYTRTTHPKPELAIAIDTSRSMGLPDGGRTRLAVATAALREGPFADHLRKHFTLRWYAVGPDASPVDGQRLDSLEANGETTHLADALRTVAEQSRGDGPGPRRLRSEERRVGKECRL